MFTKSQLLMIRSALTVQQKSVQRLANKEGQPESVAAEYRKVDGDIRMVQQFVDAEVRKLDEAEVAKLKK